MEERTKSNILLEAQHVDRIETMWLDETNKLQSRVGEEAEGMILYLPAVKGASKGSL